MGRSTFEADDIANFPECCQALFPLFRCQWPWHRHFPACCRAAFQLASHRSSQCYIKFSQWKIPPVMQPLVQILWPYVTTAHNQKMLSLVQQTSLWYNKPVYERNWLCTITLKFKMWRHQSKSNQYKQANEKLDIAFANDNSCYSHQWTEGPTVL